MGLFVAKALKDERLLDLPLSNVFWKKILGVRTTFLCSLENDHVKFDLCIPCTDDRWLISLICISINLGVFL